APRDRQRDAFAGQLALAAAAGKPAVVHARDADADVAALLRNQPDAVAILHSFSSAGLLRAALDAGHYVSFSGMVTFRSWALDDAVRAVPADRLLLETDAPYLAPVPHRGRRNEPAFVAETARRVAAVRGMAFEDLARTATANAARLFGTRLAC
ncbi:MAG TPA: TatD family hydrolase, partial [Gemmatimonadales bacterium]|nr:TatD family hydrolase [Gemmatimonadales bacterium]